MNHDIYIWGDCRYIWGIWIVNGNVLFKIEVNSNVFDGSRSCWKENSPCCWSIWGGRCSTNASARDCRLQNCKRKITTFLILLFFGSTWRDPRYRQQLREVPRSHRLELPCLEILGLAHCFPHRSLPPPVVEPVIMVSLLIRMMLVMLKMMLKSQLWLWWCWWELGGWWLLGC